MLPDSARDPVPSALLFALCLKAFIVAVAPAEELFLAVGPAEAEAPDAVAAASAAAGASEYLGPTVQYRHARIAPGLLDRARAAAERGDSTVGLIDLNLFEGASFRVAGLRAAPTSTGYSLAGELEGVPLSAVTLVVNGEVIAGEVRLPGATYTVRSVGEFVEIRETNEQALPECAEPETPPPLAGAIAPGGDLPALDFQASTALTYSDVLVVYTTAAKDKVGGEAAMEALIDLWVAAANGYYESSGVDLRIRLAHTEELDYEETRGSYELIAFQRKGDGLMDEVHAMRDAVGADLVHLIERWGSDGTLSYCGVAYLMTEPIPSFAAYAFGVTDVDCGSVTFAHELGHNMGLNHDRYATDVYSPGLTNSPYVHSYGYVNQKAFASNAPSSARWVTIMAYKTQCRHAGVDCLRIGRFSNPARTYLGDPLGVWPNGVADAVTGPAAAAATLNETRTTVAAWRSAPSAPRIVSLKRRTPADELTRSDTLTWRLAFSQEVTNVTGDDFELSGSGLGTTTLAVTAKSGSQRIYDIAVTGGVESFDGAVTLGFASGQDIRNPSGVDLVATWPAHAERIYTLDNTAPSPSIWPSGAGSSPFVATVAFGEDVTGFSNRRDVTATGATVGKPSRSDPRTYTVQVTPTGSTAATITLSVGAAAATDLAGNESVAVSRDVAWDPSTAASLTVSGYSDGSVAENTAWTSATPATGGSPSGSVFWTQEGVDAELFTIDSSTGVLGLPGQDYERPADADVDRVFEVTARATDAKGNSATAGVNVTVTDAVESRSLRVQRGASQKIVDGSGYASWPFLTCQPWLSCRQAGIIYPATWTKTGADEALFSQLRNGALLLADRDFEAPEDADRDNDYWMTVHGADADGNTASKTLRVQVIKGPPRWLAVSGASSGTVADGSEWTSSTPAVPGASGAVTWTLEGPDAALFSVGSGGVLTLAAQDYDNPADADGNNVYEVLLRATDAQGNSGTERIAVTVNEAQPGGGGGPPPGGGGGPPPPDPEPEPEPDPEPEPEPEPDPEPDPEPEPPPPPPPPTVSVSAAEASESAGAVVFDVRLSRSSGSVVTVDYATADGAGAGGAKAGQDYTATAGTLRFAAGSRAERIRVPVTDDGRYEAASETFTLTLRRPGNATLAGGGSVLRVTGTIHDDDDGPPTAAFELIESRCDEELCRARTDARVEFVATSTGKVLSRLWEFGDGRTSRSRRVQHAWSSPGFYRVTLSVSDGATTSTASRVFLVEAAEPRGTCVADAGTRCLRDSRYAVSVEWLSADGEGGSGGVVHEGTNDSGMFRFFDRDNWEVLIKVLDGCSVNGHVWVFGASPTNLGYVIRVTDTVTGTVREYRNEPGRPAAAITDVTAFPKGCRP